MSAGPPPPGRRERLAAHHRALRLEAGSVAGDARLLWQQLSNRLRWYDGLADAVRGEEERRLRACSPPWFRVLSPPAESPQLVGGVAARGDLAFLDGSRLLTLDGDTFTTWDGRTGMQLRSVVLDDGAARAFAVSPAATMVVVETPATLRVHDLATGAVVSRPENSAEPSSPSAAAGAALALRYGTSVGRSGASMCLAPNDALVAGMQATGEVTVWDARTGHVRTTLPGEPGLLTACAFTPDAAAVLLGTRDGAVLVWRHAAGGHLPLERPTAVDPEEAVVLGCAVSPDGAFAVAVDGERVTVWDLPGGRLRWTRQHFGSGRCCAVSPDGSTIVTGGERGVLRLWDAASGELTGTLAGQADTVTRCAVSADGSLVASGAKDGTRLWDPAVTGGRERFDAHDGRVTALVFSPDGEQVASAGADRRVLLWESATRDLVRAVPGHDDAVQDCAFAGSGQLLVTAGRDGTARLWDLVTGDERARLASGLDPWWGCAVSPDGREALLCGVESLVRVALPSGSRLATYPRSVEAWRCRYAPDGTWAVVTGGDGTVTFWDAATEQTHAVAAHDRAAVVCATSPDGAFAVTGGEDGTVRVWDAATREVRLVLRHDAAVWGCAVTADARYVASTSWDRTLRLWDADDGHEVMRLTLPAGLHGCAADPTRLRIAYGDLTGRVHLVEPVGLAAGPVVLPPLGRMPASEPGAGLDPDGIDRALAAPVPRERILVHATKTCLGCGLELELLRHACPRCGSPLATPPGVEEMQFMEMRQGRAMELVNRGTLRFQAGDLDAAEAAFREAADVNPWNATACGNLGVVLSRRGRTVEALEWVEKAVAIDPRVPGGQQLVERLRRG